MNNPYFRLMRFDKPIGIYLLLYPTLWALILAQANFKITLIFIIGVVLMRSAGCVINDFADRKIDKLVDRTKNRPLTSGEISKKSALLLFMFLILLAFILVLFTNNLTILLSLVAVFLAAIYPFTKRFFILPQFFLGLAFAMSVPMSFAATMSFIPAQAWWVFSATIIWTIIYDTMYAMSDKAEDLKIGIKSSAIFFGKYDKIIIGFLQILLLINLVIIGIIFDLNIFYFLSIIGVAILMIYHQFLIKNRDKFLCFKAFLHNNYIGLIVLIGIILT